MFKSLIPDAKSLRYIENRIGLNMSPCLTPEATPKDSVNKPLTLI